MEGDIFEYILPKKFNNTQPAEPKNQFKMSFNIKPQVDLDFDL